MGPLEYVVIEFEGNHLTGEIVPELHRLRDLGIVRVVDLLLIQKDAQGSVSARELSDLSEEEAKPYWPIAGEVLDLLSEADVETAGATHLQETIRNAQGRVLSGGLLPAAEVERLAAELMAEHAATPM